MPLLNLIIFIFLNISTANASVALVTSLVTNEESESNYNYQSEEFKIELEFRRLISKESKAHNKEVPSIQVINKATLREIWNVFHDKSISAIFFIGHGTEDIEIGGSLKSSQAILDYQFNDVKFAFSHVHSELRYLAIVSCFSSRVVKGFHSQGAYQRNRNLKIKSFDTKIRLGDGMRESVKDYFSMENTFDAGSTSEETYSQHYRVRLKRSIHEPSCPLLILINGKVVGIFDGIENEEEVVITLNDTWADPSVGLTLRVDSGLINSMTRFKIGKIEMSEWSSYNQCDFEMKKGRSGKPLGLFWHQYELTCQ